jgi:HK97 family phage prohead protease
MYKYKILEMEVKDVDRKEGIVSGYFSAFNVKDSDGDVIHPGAFTKTIADLFPKGRIKHLLNHDPSKPLGKILELKEDDYGLFYRSQIGKHSLGLDFIKMVESDLIKEHSIGFNDLTPRDKKNAETHNNITEVKLYEGSSLTAWGANEFTPLIEMKGLDKIELLSNRMRAFESFVKNSDATDETIELCIIQIKQLGQVIETMISTQAAENALEPQKGSNEAKDLNNISNIKNYFELWNLNK